MKYAPVLDRWAIRYVEGGYARLVGFVTGHAVVLAGREVMTSPVLYLAPDGRRVGTCSGTVYRLGVPREITSTTWLNELRDAVRHNRRHYDCTESMWTPRQDAQQ